MTELWLPQQRPPPLFPNEVYFDDTGANKKEQPVFMWCGYLANMRYWVEFTKKWTEVLDEKPALPFWHQARARARDPKPPFDKLTNVQLMEKEEKLASLAGWKIPEGGGFGCVGLMVRLPWVYHDKYIKDKILYGRNMIEEHKGQFRATSVSRAQTIAFRFASVMAFTIVKQWNINSPVNYIYDEIKGDPYQDGAMEAHRITKTSFKGQEHIVGSLTFANGEERRYAPLQAADMLAWHLGKRSRRKADCEGDDRMWKYLERMPLNEVRIGPSKLEEYVEMYNKLQLSYEELFEKDIASRPKEGSGPRRRKKK